MRALAAAGRATPRVRQALLRDVGRGQDFFRSAVIEALGDYKAAYAVDAADRPSRSSTARCQDDAALALGQDRRQARARDAGRPAAHGAARRRSRRSPPRSACSASTATSHENYLVETLRFADKNAGFQELLRGAAAGLGALAIAGHAEAVDALFDVGIPSRDPTRAPVALALATVALRNTPLMLTVLEKRARPRRARSSCSREGFDMLEEDLEKERFFAVVRRAYWEAPEGSPARELMQDLIGKLDF